MKTPERIHKLLHERLRDKETGLSLVETLIAIALFSIVAVMAISIIVTTMDSSARFSEVSTTQNEVMQAASTIQRDVSIASSITVATATQMTFLTRQSNDDYENTIFSYDPAVSTNLPDRADTSKLPNYKAIIEIRYNKNTNTTGQNILVKGYDASAYPDRDGLFSYFNAKNDSINMPVTTQANRDRIVRVEFRIAAKAAGRGTYIQIESSATPSYSLPPGVTSNNIHTQPQCPANLNPTIVPTETQATVTWNAPAGATSYTLYRYNMSNGGALEQSWVIPNPGTVSFVDSGLQWGRTYQYAIQSNGPAGSSQPCGYANATVVPEQIQFSNINSLQQNLAAQKANANAETLTAPAITNVPTRTQATQNIQAGNRYTVARGLVNQLAWTTSFGTTGYNVYQAGNPTPVAVINSAGTLFWQDTAPKPGDVTDYIIKAFNVGGESIASTKVTLISPPVASTFSASMPDTSTRSTTTDNVFTVTNRAPNTTGFLTYRVSSAAASVDCANVGASANLNFTASSLTDSTVEWGTASCYRFIPFNDAGNGVVSDPVNVNQLPGKFNVIGAYSTQYQNINTNAPLPAGTQCWVTNVSSTDAPCNVYAPRSTNNRFADGLFGAVYNTKTNLNVSWTNSYNAYADYTVTKTRTATGGIYVDQGSATSTNRSPYVNANQSTVFLNEMPGSAYNFVVQAKAANGKTRNSGTASTVSNPDIPRSMDLNFQSRSSSMYPSNYYRMMVYVDTGVFRGLASQTVINANSASGPNQAVVNGASGVQTIYSPAYTYGYHGESTYTILNLNGVTSYSASIGRAGSTTPGCSAGACASDWLSAPEQYPTYYAGAHYRYNAGGYASGSADGGPGNSGAIPTPSAPSGPPADGGIPEGTTYNCSLYSESDPNFTTEYGCSYGTGIPDAPTQLKIAGVSGSNVSLTWNSVPYVTGYNIKATVNGTVKTFTSTTNSYNLALNPGDNASIVVNAYNDAANSSDSAPVTINLPAIPQNLSLVSTNGNVATISWDSAKNASSYQITMVTGGATQTFVTTATSYALSLPAGQLAQVTVAASNSSATSVPSSTLVINPPSAPANLRVLSQSGNVATLGWDTVLGAGSYIVSVTVNGTTTNYTASGTSYAVTIPFGSNAIAVVQAVVDGVKSAASDPLSLSSTTPAPGAVTGFAANNSSGATAITPSTLVWNAATCAAGSVQYLVTQTAPTSATLANWITNTWVAITPTADTSYTYSIVSRCVNGSDISPNSPASTISVTARYSTPAAPASAPATNNPSYFVGTNATVTFTANTCPVGVTPVYKLYANGTLVATTSAATATVAVGNTAGNINYTYTVSCTSNGYTTAESPASPAKSVTVLASLAAPANVRVTGFAGTKATVAWNAVTNATSYKVTWIGEDGVTQSATTSALTYQAVFPSGTASDFGTVYVNALASTVTSPNSTVVKTRIPYGDYSGDGIPDVLAYWTSNGTGTTYKGANNGGFGATTSIGGGWTSISMTIANQDYNNDGALDMIALDTSGNLWFYPGQNDGTLPTRTLITSGKSTWNYMMGGDFNNDGNMDIIARDTSGNLWFYNGTGNGINFSAATQIGTSWNVITAFSGVADFNNDGIPDFFAVDNTDHIRFYAGNGNGFLKAAVIYGTGWGVMNFQPGVGDFNNDGNFDFVVRNNSSGVLYDYLGDGKGGFMAGTPITVGAGWNAMGYFISGRDFNNDGNLDMIPMETSSGNLYFYAGNGSGNYVISRTTAGTGWNGVKVIN